MRDSVLVQEAMDGRRRLVERALEEGPVIVLAVVVGHGRPVRPGALADIREAALDEREHVLRGRSVEDVVGIAAGHIDRRGVGHHAALPLVTVTRAGRRARAAGRQPRAALDIQGVAQVKLARAARAVRGQHDAPALHDLERAEREDGADRGLDLHAAALGR